MTRPDQPRRHRRRPGRGPRPAAQQPAGDAAGSGDARGSERRAGGRPSPPDRKGGRGDPMRDLTGAGHSTLGVEGALRARDVNRPTAVDLEEAEAQVQLVRRHWTPPPNG